MAAAAAYEAAGAAKGATLGYVDPTKLLDKTPLGETDISKPIAEGAGQFVGALAPISKISQAVHAGMTATGVLNGVRPILSGLVQSGIVGSIYGAARKPDEETMAMRAHNALDDAATFIVWTGAGQLVDQAAQALSLGKTNAYNSLREDIINTFTKKGAEPAQAEAMADAGLKAAVERGGGWNDVTASDLRTARRAVRAGQKIVIGESPEVDGGPSQPQTAAPELLATKAPDAAVPAVEPEITPTPPSGENTALPQEDIKPAPATKIDEKSISIPGIKYLQDKFPALAQVAVGQTLPLPADQVQDIIKTAAAAGEDVLLKGGSAQEANIAAVKRFAEAAKPLVQTAEANAPKPAEAPANAKPDVFDAVEADVAKNTPVKSVPGLSDVVQSLGIQPHEMSTEQYGQAFGGGRLPAEVQAEHRGMVKEAVKAGAPVPPETLADHPGVQMEANKELARDAAQEVLTKNKISDQAVVRLVDHIVADNEAFKTGYGKDFDPEKHIIRGETKTPIDRFSGDRLQTVINLADGSGPRTGRHEAFHAISNVLLDEGEQNVLLKAFGTHEKAADAFADFQSGKTAGEGPLQKIFRKMKQFLDRLRNYFKHKKFATAEDIFEAVDSGKMGGRAAGGRGVQQYSAAFHGSPHEIDQFDLSKVGAGEGNQAFGHGLYFAGQKQVGEFYRDAIAKRQGKSGNLYKVSIPDDHEFIDYDKVLADTSPDVLSKLGKVDDGKLIMQVGARKISVDTYETTGEQLYNELSETLGSDKAASDAIAAKGVPGMKYLDELSRREGKGSSNYVIFDQRVVKNLGKQYSAENIVPKFKGTTDAVAYGKEHKNDPAAIGALENKYREMKKTFDDTMEKIPSDQNITQKIVDFGFETQFYRESLEAALGHRIDQSQYSAENLPAKREPAPRFYSQLEKTVDKKMQAKASPEQIKAMLKNSQDIRKEEIEWSGINDWLDKQKGPVTKEQVQEYLKVNGLKLNEQVRGGQFAMNANDISIGDSKPVKKTGSEFDGMNRTTVTFGDKLSRTFWISPENKGIVQIKGPDGDVLWHGGTAGMKQALAEWFQQRHGLRPKWEQYTLAGPNGSPYGNNPNSNYREFVVSIPNFGYAEKNKFLQFVEDMAETKSDKRIAPVNDADPFQSFNQLEEWIGEKYGDVNTMLEKMTPAEKKKYDQLRAAAEKSEFGSAHWSDNNVLLHVRTTDRVDPEGKRILFIEEVQSDWHEHGRSQGYVSDDKKLPDGYKAVKHPNGEWRIENNNGGTVALGGKTEQSALDVFFGDNDNSNGARVADAPFKNTWHELGMKMALRRAAEEGYDRVAWTTADMQKKRWANKPIFDYLYGKAIPQFMEKYVKKLGGNFGETKMTGVGKINSAREGTPILNQDQWGENFELAPWHVFNTHGELVGGAQTEDGATEVLREQAERNWSVNERTEYFITNKDGYQIGDQYESESDAETNMHDIAKENWRIRKEIDSDPNSKTGEKFIVEKHGEPKYKVHDKEGFALFTTDSKEEAAKRMRKLEREGKDVSVKKVPTWEKVEEVDNKDAADEILHDSATDGWDVNSNSEWEAYDGDVGNSEYFESEDAALSYMRETASAGWSVGENQSYDPDTDVQPEKNQLEHKTKNTVTVPAVEITPAMRDSLLYTGQPLYKAEDVKRDINRVMMPSRQQQPKVYTERMALRRSLQRQATAAARAAGSASDRIHESQSAAANAIKGLIPKENQGDYLRQLVSIDDPEDLAKFLLKTLADSDEIQSKSDAAADKDLKAEEIQKRREGMKADRAERNQLRRLMQREAAVSREAARYTAAEITKVKKGIVDTIQAQLPATESGRFLKMVASAKSPKDVVRATQRIDEAVEKYQRKVAINSIKRELQRVQASQSIAVDYRSRVNNLMNDVLLAKPTAATMQRAIDLQKYIDSQRAAGRDVTVPQYVLDRMKVLSGRPLASMRTDELEDVLNQITTIADLGKTKLRTIRHIDSMNKERDLKDLASSTMQLNSKQVERPFPGTNLGAGGAAMNMLRKAYNLGQRVKFSITPIDVFFDMMDGMQNYSGANYRIFKARIDSNFQNYLDESARMKEETVKKGKGLNRKNFERIGVHAIAAQEDGMEKLANLGFSPEQIKSIKLTPQENEFYKWMRKTLDETRPRIAETMRNVYNADLGEVKNYFPFMTDFELANEEDLDRRMAQQIMGFRKKNPEMGFTQKRVGTGDQKVNIDALDVFSRHMDDVAYLNNVGPTTKYLGEMANTEQYKQLAGDFGTRMVRDWIDTLARKGGVVGGQQIAVLDKLRSNIGAATLAFKLSSTLVQITPLLEGATLIGTHAFTGGINFSLSPAWRHFVLKNMPEIRERGGDDPALNEFVKGGAIRTGMEKMKEMGFWTLKKLDEWAAGGVAAGALEKFFNDKGIDIFVKNSTLVFNPRKGIVADIPKLLEEAKAYAQRVVRRTQASPFFKDVPMAITRGMLTGNRSFDRALFQFQNFALNQYSLLAYEGGRAGVLNGKPGVSLSVWTWTILAIMATAGIRIGLDQLKAEIIGEKHRKKKDLEQELIKQSVQELLSRVPFLSQAMSLVTWGSMPLPAFEAVRRFGQGAAGVYGYYDKDNKLLHGKKKPFQKAATAAVTAAAQVAGVPGAVEAGDFVRRSLK